MSEGGAFPIMKKTSSEVNSLKLKETSSIRNHGIELDRVHIPETTFFCFISLKKPWGTRYGYPPGNLQCLHPVLKFNFEDLT